MRAGFGELNFFVFRGGFPVYPFSASSSKLPCCPWMATIPFVDCRPLYDAAGMVFAASISPFFKAKTIESGLLKNRMTTSSTAGLPPQ